jgi:hypothetical protein
VRCAGEAYRAGFLCHRGYRHLKGLVASTSN